MRLTAELILASPCFLNPLKDRELSLRGNKIALIENLGATQDSFDTIDLSENEIQKIENFPLLSRLRTLFFHNNHINRIASGLNENLPKLECLILSNNKLENLSDLAPLSSLTSLRMLSLTNNPVTQKRHYRLYVIHLLPRLKSLDFSKVKAKEKRQARILFRREESEKMKKMDGDVTTKTGEAFTPGENIQNNSSKNSQAIKTAIQETHTLEEVRALERNLITGKLPTKKRKNRQEEENNGDNEEKDEDEDEEEEEEENQ